MRICSDAWPLTDAAGPIPALTVCAISESEGLVLTQSDDLPNGMLAVSFIRHRIEPVHLWHSSSFHL